MLSGVKFCWWHIQSGKLYFQLIFYIFPLQLYFQLRNNKHEFSWCFQLGNINVLDLINIQSSIGMVILTNNIWGEVVVWCSVWYDGGGGSQWVIQKIRVTNRLNVYSIEVNVKFSESIEFGLIQVEDSCQVNWIKWDIMTVSIRICECKYANVNTSCEWIKWISNE